MTAISLAVGWFSEGQQQRRAAAAGRGQLHGTVRLRAQRQARQSRHLLAHGPDRSGLLETKLPHPGEWERQSRHFWELFTALCSRLAATLLAVRLRAS